MKSDLKPVSWSDWLHLFSHCSHRSCGVGAVLKQSLLHPALFLDSAIEMSECILKVLNIKNFKNFLLDAFAPFHVLCHDFTFYTMQSYFADIHLLQSIRNEGDSNLWKTWTSNTPCIPLKKTTRARLAYWFIALNQIWCASAGETGFQVTVLQYFAVTRCMFTAIHYLQQQQKGEAALWQSSQQSSPFQLTSFTPSWFNSTINI